MREKGFYWIKFKYPGAEWTVALYERGAKGYPWDVVGSDELIKDEDVIVGSYLGTGPKETE